MASWPMECWYEGLRGTETIADSRSGKAARPAESGEPADPAEGQTWRERTSRQRERRFQ